VTTAITTGITTGISASAPKTPQLQPDATAAETSEAHPLSMGRRDDDGPMVTTVRAEAPPDLKPWREVGWIFRDGSCIAIERRGEEVRHRVLGD
jgi:hypothetical protein